MEDFVESKIFAIARPHGRTIRLGALVLCSWFPLPEAVRGESPAAESSRSSDLQPSDSAGELTPREQQLVRELAEIRASVGGSIVPSLVPQSQVSDRPDGIDTPGPVAPPSYHPAPPRWSPEASPPRPAFAVGPPVVHQPPVASASWASPPAGPPLSAVAVLRQSAAQLDQTANRLEEFELYDQADNLRRAAQQLRLTARQRVAAAAP
jgi:hypothetical protein